MTFEGQAAIRLEALARQAEPDHAYRLPFDGHQWDYRPLLSAVLADVEARVPPAVIARRFHEGIADAVLSASLALGSGARAIVLSGGVFQNRLLAEATINRLRRHGLEAWTNERVPANDGGISLGQAAIAATRG
jgi:hydrogenase maturation protein HypF